jgi:hypothetical protein
MPAQEEARWQALATWQNGKPKRRNREALLLTSK